MELTKFPKFIYLRGECLQNIYYDKIMSHANLFKESNIFEDV